MKNGMGTLARWTRFVAAGLLATALVACGGGGGGGGTSLSGTGSGSSSSGSGSSGSTGGSGGSTTIAAAVSVALYNSAGTAVTSIGVDGGYTARAKVTDTTGAVVASKLVTFTLSDSSLATLSSATALTDSAGIAQVSVTPVSVVAVGAVTVSASATIGSASVSGTSDFAVSMPALTLSALSIGSTGLASGGGTTLSVTALLNGAASSSVPVNVVFSASCGKINTSALNASVTTNGSGVASATYSSVSTDGTLCSGIVTITASSSGATAKTATITVAAPVANAITFASATPGQIYVAGSGAAEQSVAVFKVLSSGTALPGTSVTFSLTTNPGGAGIGTRGSATPVTVTSDSSGNAQVTIFSGTIPGPVKVRAQLVSDSTVFAETQNLTIASGPPSQRFMSLAVGTFNIEGATLDGAATTLTVRLADRQGNPVVDGTVVNFTAEGGQVASSCATAIVGGISQCTVNFQSQNPRPAGGRVSVLAYAEGTKDYTDVNSNNVFDLGTDTLLPTAGGGIGDAYRDDNENNVFDTGEFIIQRGVSGGTCLAAGWPFPSTTSCNTGLATTVRQQTVLFFSSSTPVLKNFSASTGAITFNLGSSDYPLLPMPAGTTVSASGTGNCSIGTVAGTPVVNRSPTVAGPTEDRSTGVNIPLTGCASGNVVTILVTSPSGVQTSFPVTL
ncbi:hypothetical protein GT347_09575 [Xylophilus rhododendri]|uniref:Big-1 domain-containing protein n=1 Tax=Xylophilus rhododendri TaxID=2697032 RepID=A0A857J5W5_9BURK|nr:hypothetical protein [Xylophilus rhododendri]QHI98218.1 hypothetical protein GT347_09575 [Xylophilus rhododendri]